MKFSNCESMSPIILQYSRGVGTKKGMKVLLTNRWARGKTWRTGLVACLQKLSLTQSQDGGREKQQKIHIFNAANGTLAMIVVVDSQFYKCSKKGVFPQNMGHK